MRVEYFFSKKRQLDFLKIHYGQQTIYIDGYGCGDAQFLQVRRPGYRIYSRPCSGDYAGGASKYLG